MATITSTENKWLVWVLTLILSVSLSLSGYFFSDAYKRLSSVENKTERLQTETAVITSNRFSWLEQKTILDNERLAMDRRIIKLEETNVFIKDSLVRIERLIVEHLKDGNMYGSSTE